MERPGVGKLPFKTLSFLDGGGLFKPFTVDEVMVAVWDCDSFKSPGLDDVNSSFINEFWKDLQEDIMRFIMKFHQNGKLARGINATLLLSSQKSRVRRS
jgi:hypothetical protein